MTMVRHAVFWGLVLSTSVAAAAPEAKPRALVLNFTVSKELDVQLARTLQNIFVSHLDKLNRYELMQQADVAALIGIEAEKQMLGCDDSSCLAQIGGALGARRIISGTIALLGGREVLTVKLIDADEVKLQKQLTQELPSDAGDYSEALRVLSYELFDLEAPVLVTPWYARPWVWGVAAGVVAGAAAGIYLAVDPAEPPQANLGRVEF